MSRRNLSPVMRDLVTQASNRYKILESQVLERGNDMLKVEARAFIARELRRRDPVRYSYPVIGRMLGGYHHTTVMNLCNPRQASAPRRSLPRLVTCPDLSGEWAI